MGEWRGPVSREGLKWFSVIAAFLVAAILLNGLFLVSSGDIWDYLVDSALLCAVWIGVPLFLVWFYFRRVWSLFFKRYEMDRETVVKTLGEVLNTRSVSEEVPGMEAFRIGRVRILIKGDQWMTVIFLGPSKERAEVERLKGLVDKALA